MAYTVATNKMKVGQIIKNKFHEVGMKDQYMRITEVLGEGMYEVQYQNKPGEHHVIHRKTVTAPIVLSLAISEEMLFALKKANKDKVSHIATERWMTAYKKKVDLIRFYTMAKHYEGIFSIKNVTQRKSIGENIVEITVEERIF